MAGLLRPLLVSWLLLLPVTVLVASGSVSLRHTPVLMAALGALAALALPLLLLLRQWLGWSYVNRRLLAERISYEESGWYDGQVWEKPLAWRQQDLLIAQHQVRPVLLRLRQTTGGVAALLLLGAASVRLWAACCPHEPARKPWWCLARLGVAAGGAAAARRHRRVAPPRACGRL